MQRHDDMRKVTSICHCLRSLPGTGIVTHSRDGAVMTSEVETTTCGTTDQLVESARLSHVALLADLRAALGPTGASAEPLELALYARDAGVSEGNAVAVCWPRSAADVAA